MIAQIFTNCKAKVQESVLLPPFIVEIKKSHSHGQTPAYANGILGWKEF